MFCCAYINRTQTSKLIRSTAVRDELKAAKLQEAQDASVDEMSGEQRSSPVNAVVVISAVERAAADGSFHQNGHLARKRLRLDGCTAREASAEAISSEDSVKSQVRLSTFESGKA